jgi:cobalamin biosynthesis Mg chelatase CobN
VLQITSPGYETVVFNDNVSVSASGAFSYTVKIVANSSEWVYGTYTVTVTSQEPAPMSASTQFSYTPQGVESVGSTSTVTTTSVTVTATTTPSVTVTTTSYSTTTDTLTAPASTVTNTAPASTVTNTQTTTQTSTVTNGSAGIPDWAYAALIVLFLVGIGVGLAARNLQDANSNRPAARLN